MQIKRESLLRVVEILSMVNQRAGIPPSEYVRIIAGKKKVDFYLSSDALCRVEAEKDGDWPVKSPYFVDRNLFMPFIQAAKTIKSVKDFEFEEVDKQLMITHGRRKITFTDLPPVTGYGKIEIPDDAVEINLTEEQRALMRCAESCATSDPITPHLNCVYITEDGLVLASNQLVIFHGTTRKFKNAIPMPLYLLSMLELEGANKLVFTEKFVVLKMDRGEILQTVPQQALKGFPSKKIGKRITESESFQKLFTVQAVKIAEVLQRFSVYMASVRRQDRVVKVVAKKNDNVLTISSSVAQVKLQETLKLKHPVKVAVKAEWPLDLILPVLTFLGTQDTDLIISADEDSPYFVDGGAVKLVLARKVP